MKRMVKNIIVVLIIVVMIGANVITMNYIKNNESTVINGESNSEIGMPGDNARSSDDEEASPPDLPSDSSDSSSSTTKPEDGEDPPDKPDGEDSDSSNAPGDIPDSGSQPEMGSDSEMPSGGGEIDSATITTTSSISTIEYVVFGVEDFVIAFTLIYLIMSGFNKKTFKETFASSDKTIIVVLGTIILTGILTYTSGYLYLNYYSNNNSNNSDNIGDNSLEESSSSDVAYSGNVEITEDTTITSGSYSSTNESENAILVNGDIDVSLSNITVSKSGDGDSGDTSNFYGNNSAILAKGGANLTLKNITVTTSGDGANGVFSYGGSATTNNTSSDGTTITISDSEITTTGDNAGGIMTTGGGVTKASNLTINTAGTSSAAIRTDRGGGTVTVDGGTYTTTGAGSPTIYSTADITVENAKLIAKTSEGIVIEGANSVTINSCTLTDSNTKLNGQSTTYKNIFLYQSMSGDASSGTAIFTATDSKITTNNGDSFYVTNTTAKIVLENNTIKNKDSDGNFLRAQTDSWGNSGSNGGDVTLVMTNQDATGNIVIDSISTLDMTMEDDSYYEGTINSANEAKSITLKLDSSSSIKLTGNSYVTSLEDEDSDYSNIDFNGYKLYVNGKAIN